MADCLVSIVTQAKRALRKAAASAIDEQAISGFNQIQIFQRRGSLLYCLPNEVNNDDGTALISNLGNERRYLRALADPQIDGMNHLYDAIGEMLLGGEAISRTLIP